MSNLDDLNLYFRSLEVRDEFSGVVLITQGETTFFSEAYGYASRTWKVKNTLNTRFDTASITKLFTAVATLQLIDQKLISFDTKVIDFLGLERTDISREVNVFHLLTHTSGIGDDADEEAGENYEDLWKKKPNYSVTQTADFLPQFMYKPPNFPPGEGCRYCNVGYVLLGLVIEKVTGAAYRDYIRKNIFAKASMIHSDFFRMDRVNKNVAEGSDPIRDETGAITGWKRNIYSYPPIGSPDGGAYVTAGDLSRFLQEVQNGQLLSPELTQAFLTPQVLHSRRGGWDQKYGLGLWYYMTPFDEVIFYQKEGINPGVSGVLRHYPKQNIKVILLSNMEEGVWKPLQELHKHIVQEILGTHARKTTSQ